MTELKELAENACSTSSSGIATHRNVILEGGQQFLNSIMYKISQTAQSVLSDCRLDNWGSIPTEAEGFSSILCIQTGSGARGLIPRGKAWPWHDADHTCLPVPSLRKSRSYTSSPHKHHPWRVARPLYLYHAEDRSSAELEFFCVHLC
jgi:hypothetical protein